MKIGDVYYEKNTVTKISHRNNTVSETKVEKVDVVPQKWISVSERLPEEDGLYLVYTEEQPFVCPFEDNEFFIDDVLAWMQLPKPYEPQERSEE